MEEKTEAAGIQSLGSEIFINENFDEQEEEELELEDLFNKNTESFRCLAQILISRSSLLRNPLYHFPPLEDPGIDDAFNYKEPEPIIDDIGIEAYLKMCKDFNIVPVSRVVRSLPTSKIDLKYYGLTEKQVRALMEGLKTNAHVTQLSLQDNWLTPRGVEAITEMLEKNKTISSINLCECRIKSEGAWLLSPGLVSTTTLRELDLSFNGLEDAGLESLAAGLEDNYSIAVLNLSHNNLGEESAFILAGLMQHNDMIENLDLSWNNFCTAKGNKAFFEALKENPVLKVLNLAWNGIGSKESVTPIMKFLRKSVTLEHLDMGNNRLTGDPLRQIIRGVAKCPTLFSVSFASNPITPEEAEILANLCFKRIRFLDMENVFVNKSFVYLWQRLTKKGASIKIGGILSNYTIHGPDVPKLLFLRAKFVALKAKKKKAQKDFGQFILQMPEKPMEKQDFQNLIKKFKAKALTKDPELVNAIADQFPAKKQKIDVAAMRESYMSYFPYTAPPPPKKKKKGKKS